jgi:excisionase family DNA binding protein
MLTRDSPDRLLTITEASELLRIHVGTLRRWTNEGRLQARRVGRGRSRRFRMDDLMALLEQSDAQAVSKR